ncbi:hypothetical protein BJ741DRAFT_667246 [Chytriomyces cf. hyalinus JEL632]|nr:hypothetical protein BJ741DRAFT_667246 [Chytriomyces cf. hyalinus JEL632]
MPFTAAIIADLHEKLKSIESQLVHMIPLTELLMSQFPMPQNPKRPSVTRSSESFKPHLREAASHKTLPKGVIDQSSLHSSAMIEQWASNEEWEHQVSTSQMSGIQITSDPIGPQADCSNSVFSAAETEASGNIWKQLTKFQNKETNTKHAFRPDSSRSTSRASNTQRSHRFSTALGRSKMSNESTSDPSSTTETKTPEIIKCPSSPNSIKKSHRTGPKADTPLKDSPPAAANAEGNSINSTEALCGSLVTIEEAAKTPASEISSRFHQEDSTPKFLSRNSSENMSCASPSSSAQTSHVSQGVSNAVTYRQELKSESSKGPSKESLASDMSSKKPEHHRSLSKPSSKFLGSSEFVKLRKARGSIMEIVIKNSTVPMYNQTGSVATFNEELGAKDVKPDEQQPNTRELFRIAGFSRYSFFSVNWELFMAAIYIATIWFIPFKLAMDQDIDWSFSIALSLIFAMDNFVTFMTVQPRPKLLRIVKNPTLKDWQKYYLKTNFVVDFIATVPFELIPYGDCHYLWVIRCIRVYKLPRTISGSPYFMLMRKKVETMLGIGQTFSGFFPLMFTLCAFLHVQACVLFFIGRLSQFSNSVIAQVQHRSDFDKYVWALFTAVGNTFPVFYKFSPPFAFFKLSPTSQSYQFQSRRPNTPEEQISTLCFTIIGAGLYASIVGTISSLSIGMDASGRLYKQKLDELKEYMGWKDLDDITRRKVLKYYELKYRGKFFEEATLLNEMNDSLRMEIAAHNCKQLISKVGFLHREMDDGRDHIFLGRIATALSAVYFIPGDIIISAGDMGSEMFFILKGTVNIVVNGVKVGQLVDGAFFGELALIANIPRTATVQALTPCSLYRLTRVDLMRILPEFEDMKQRMDIIYQQRMEKVRKEEQLRNVK